MKPITAFVPQPPEAGEYHEYYGRYISLVRHSNITAALRAQLDDTMGLLRTISATKSLHRYQPDKWSIREIIGHLSDSERIFAYRALRIARADQTPLPGFEQDDYVKASGADQRTWESLNEEFEAVRRATVALYDSLESDAWLRQGTANGNTISVRALAWITAGHELHHLKILRERYLNGNREG